MKRYNFPVRKNERRKSALVRLLAPKGKSRVQTEEQRQKEIETLTNRVSTK